MNRSLLLNFLGVILLGGIFICTIAFQHGSDVPLTPKKYIIDGSFDDWKTYETAKTDTGIDWSKAVVTGFEGIHLKEFYYDNDDKFFYLFFKFRPNLQERYEKNHSTCYLGYLYIDTDANTNSGCSSFDSSPIPGMAANKYLSGTATIPGSEIQIEFSTGIYMNGGPPVFYVSYTMKRWDAAAKHFDQTIRTENSRDDASLIAHGRDGVEVAIPLADLRIAKGSAFAFTFCGDLVPYEYANRTISRLR